MALETVSTIYDLVATNPTAGDPVSQADDHLRNIKAALLASFANTVGTQSQQQFGKFIVKVGSGTTAADGTASVSYTAAFPNAPLFTAAVLATNSVNAPIFVNRNSGTTSGFNVFACNTSGTGQAVTFSWIAIGY